MHDDLNAVVRPAIDTSAGQPRPVYEQIIELDDSFSFSGYQVVRSEFFSHLYEPSVTFNDFKFYVNKTCINRLPDTRFVQVLVNPAEKKLVIRPSHEGERGAFLWYSAGKHGKSTRQVTCRVFYAMVMQMMGWSPDYRYKLLGKMVSSKNEFLFVFDLNAPIIYQRVQYDPETGKPAKQKTNMPTYPQEWEGRFGLSLEENQKSLQINIFNGYAVYGITEKKPGSIPAYHPAADERNREL